MLARHLPSVRPVTVAADAPLSESNLDVYRDMEVCFERGWSDGLPVVPPYGSLVNAMLDALGWAPTEVIGAIPAQSIEIRAEHLAAAAVMAGCKTEYVPVIRAVAEALVDPAFNVSGVEVTTGGVAALVIVSGPIVEELGFEYGSNALGANCRANATVGRFAQMAHRAVQPGASGRGDRARHGTPRGHRHPRRPRPAGPARAGSRGPSPCSPAPPTASGPASSSASVDPFTTSTCPNLRPTKLTRSHRGIRDDPL